MNKNSKIYVVGHRGLVGSAIVRRLKKEGYSNLLLKKHIELDLLDQKSVNDFFKKEKPAYVFLAAAKVGGILAANSQPADFIYENLLIECNVVHAAYVYKIKKLLFLGSSCIYPKMALQPLKEECLLTASLEETNKSYAVAKIAGIIMCQSYNRQYNTNFISVMPTNIYGPYDNFDLMSSHVLPALIRKFHEGKIEHKKEVVVWGAGASMREFLHCDDLADACIFLMNIYNDSEIVNIGTGIDLSIRELAEKIKKLTGFKGNIVWNTTMMEGTPKKCLDVSKLHAIGWHHKINLDEGIKLTYQWYKNNLESLK